MNVNDYQKEVNRLSHELNLLDSRDVEPLGGGGKFMRYKSYAFITFGILALLYLIKPKLVLKISTDKGEPEIVLNKSKLIIWWILLSISLCAFWWGYGKLKKSD